MTIAILHYQTPDLLDECLTRVLQAAPGVRTVVLDAGDARPLPSDWRSRRQDVADAGVELVRIENRSYAHAVNAALRLTGTDYLAFMNADVYVRPETFANLDYAMGEPSVAAVGPLVRDSRGRLQDQGLPYRRYQRRVLRGAFAVDVPWLSGCMQVVRMAAVRGVGARNAPSDSHAAADGDSAPGPDAAPGRELAPARHRVPGRQLAPARHRAPAQRPPPRPPVGGMDETFRFYNEDVEWGARLTSAGWTIRLVATPVVHLGGSATPAGSRAFFIEGLRGGYAFSQRYRPAWFRAAHRQAVMLWAALMERFGPADRRTTFREVRRMFADRRWDDTPFGATLADREPAAPSEDG